MSFFELVIHQMSRKHHGNNPKLHKCIEAIEIISQENLRQDHHFQMQLNPPELSTGPFVIIGEGFLKKMTPKNSKDLYCILLMALFVLLCIEFLCILRNSFLLKELKLKEINAKIHK